MRITEKLKIFLIRKFDNAASDKLRAYYKKKYNVTIGRYTYGYRINDIGQNSVIGAFCSIASGVKIGLMNHPTQYVSTNPFLYYMNRGFLKENKNIDVKIGAHIGSDVWIGNDAIILPGVHVGNGSVIAAGAVVTKDVAPYEIVGGVPAIHLKWRFEEEIRNALNESEWWEWTDDHIKRNIESFYEPNCFVGIITGGKSK